MKRVEEIRLIALTSSVKESTTEFLMKVLVLVSDEIAARENIEPKKIV